MKKSLLLSTCLVLVGQAFAQCPVGETEMTMLVTTDRYGDETTWSITAPGGSPSYASGGPYTLQAANGEYPQTPVTFCVPTGAVLDITVNDAYGDGMCCLYGDGGWELSEGATIVASGGNFTFTESEFLLVGPQSSVDMAGLTIDIDGVIAAGNQTISGEIGNFGSTAVSSFTLNYSIDGGSPVTQAVTASIASGATYGFSHSTPWNASVGSHTVMVWASNINGGSDGNTANDAVTATVGVASQSTSRVTVMEEFGSSTCPPCAPVAAQLAPALNGLFANTNGFGVAAVAYGMNWPSPGTDPSYNPDGNSRKSYYGVSGIPDAFLDGADMSTGQTSAQFQTTFNAAKAVPAFMEVAVSVVRTGTTLDVTTTVTPFATFTGSFKLHMAATENHYTYTGGTTSQNEFHYIQRKMLPNANGTTITLTEGNPVTVTESYTFVEGGVAQGNYNLWTTIEDVTIVAFVQNNSTKEIMQGGIANVVVGVEEQNALANSLSVFPNPSNGTVNVRYATTDQSQTSIELIDMLGEVVMSSTSNVGAGIQNEVLDMNALSNGMYYLSVTNNGMKAVHKVTLNK